MSELKELVIRNHLVPFLFEELEGKKAKYEKHEVLLAPLSSASSLAQYIYQLMPEVGQKTRGIYDNRILLWLSIYRDKRLKFHGKIYKEHAGVKEVIVTTAHVIKCVNDLLEDIFRISLVYYIKGQDSAKIPIRKACENFVQEYQLEECGFDAENVRIIYYRQKNKKSCSRLQFRPSNNTLNTLV